MAAAGETDDRKRFKEWMEEYNKKYPTPYEEEIRFRAFQENLRYLESRPDAHWLGLGFFSDLSASQFCKEVLGLGHPGQHLSDSDSDSDGDDVQFDFKVKPESERKLLDFEGDCDSDSDSEAEGSMPPRSVKHQRVVGCDEKETKEEGYVAVKRPRCGGCKLFLPIQAK